MAKQNKKEIAGEEIAGEEKNIENNNTAAVDGSEATDEKPDTGEQDNSTASVETPNTAAGDASEAETNTNPENTDPLNKLAQELMHQNGVDVIFYCPKSKQWFTRKEYAEQANKHYTTYYKQ